MNLALSAIGFALQADKATAATEPQFWHGVDGGKMVEFPVEQKEDELTTGLPAGVGEFRESVMPAAGYGTRAWPKSIAALLYAIMGDIATTGAGPVYTHVIEAGASLPWATVFGKKDTALQSMAASKADEIKFSWEGNGPLKVSVVWAGCTMVYEASITPVLDESLLAYFKAAGGTFSVDLNGAGETAGGKIMGGEITFKRDVEADIYSGDLLPGDVSEKQLSVETTVKYRVPDTRAVRLLVTGALNGTAPAADPIYGGFDFLFKSGATDELRFQATRVAWQTEEPEGDPKGGPGEISLKGKCYMTAGGSPLTATVKNGHASYV